MPKHDLLQVTLLQIDTPYLQHPFATETRILLHGLITRLAELKPQ